MTGVVVLGVAGYMVVQLVQIFMFGDQGAAPAVSAVAPNMPDSLLATVRADGLLTPGEVVRYAFIPAGATVRDAMFMTDSAIIRQSAAGARRVDTYPGTLMVNRSVTAGKIRGSVVMTRKAERPDTLYGALSGLETSAIFTGITAMRRATP